MEQFEQLFKIGTNTRVIDVGGTEFNWNLISQVPKVLLINIADKSHWNAGLNFTFEIGDGTNLKYADKSFDIAYSNSVIEHLFTYENQKLFAKELRRVGKSVYVQTPAREFFIEPHLVTPFIHWLPRKWQLKLAKYTLWGLWNHPDKQQINDFLGEIRLITYPEFKELFPDCEIIRERFLGMTKSYIAVRK